MMRRMTENCQHLTQKVFPFQYEQRKASAGIDIHGVEKCKENSLINCLITEK